MIQPDLFYNNFLSFGFTRIQKNNTYWNANVSDFMYIYEISPLKFIDE